MKSWRTWLPYGGALAIVAFLLEWVDYKHTTSQWSTSFYIVMVALLFALLGVWVGNRLTARPRGPDFERNAEAIAALGISPRESEVLELLAEGHSNKVIARQLDISPNTVKTHIARLFEKLDARSRTGAIGNARSLQILP